MLRGDENCTKNSAVNQWVTKCRRERPRSCRSATNAVARAGRSRPHLNMQGLLRGGGYVLFRRGCALAEKVLFHLLDDRGLVLTAGGVKPVLVQQHLAEFRPSLPGLEGDVVVDLLAQFRIERRLIQPRKLFFQLDAEDHVLSHEIPRNRRKKIISHRVVSRRSSVVSPNSRSTQ